MNKNKTIKVELEKFNKPTMKVVIFDDSDIIATSGGLIPTALDFKLFTQHIGVDIGGADGYDEQFWN